MRKTKVVVIDADNRDKGKHFLITEMAAIPATNWADRAFLALAHSGYDPGAELQGAGIIGIAIVGLKALSGVHHDELAPLMDELLSCVKIIRDPVRLPEMAAPLMENDIEEISTVYRLRKEVIELHTDFTLAGAQSMLTLASAKMSPASSTIPTSRVFSAT